MKSLAKFILVTAVMLLSTPSIAQSDVSEVSDVSEELKLAALEALIAAPADKALPLVSKVLEGNHSNEETSRVSVQKQLRCLLIFPSSLHPPLHPPLHLSRLGRIRERR